MAAAIKEEGREKTKGRLIRKGELFLISNVLCVLLLKSKKQPLKILGGATAHHMFSVHRDKGCYQRQNWKGFTSSKRAANNQLLAIISFVFQKKHMIF